MKKYNLRCQYCGTGHYVPEILFKIKLLFNGKVYVKCSKCRLVSTYRLVSHIVHDSMDLNEKEFNKTFRDIWKKG